MNRYHVIRKDLYGNDYGYQFTWPKSVAESIASRTGGKLVSFNRETHPMNKVRHYDDNMNWTDQSWQPSQ